MIDILAFIFIVLPLCLVLWGGAVAMIMLIREELKKDE